MADTPSASVIAKSFHRFFPEANPAAVPFLIASSLTLAMTARIRSVRPAARPHQRRPVSRVHAIDRRPCSALCRGRAVARAHLPGGGRARFPVHVHAAVVRAVGERLQERGRHLSAAGLHAGVVRQRLGGTRAFLNGFIASIQIGVSMLAGWRSAFRRALRWCAAASWTRGAQCPAALPADRTWDRRRHGDLHLFRPARAVDRGDRDAAPGFVLAHVALTIPWTVRLVAASLVGVDQSIEAAANLGARPLTILRRVTCR